jgi:hypothetical protein
VRLAELVIRRLLFELLCGINQGRFSWRVTYWSLLRMR